MPALHRHHRPATAVCCVMIQPQVPPVQPCLSYILMTPRGVDEAPKHLTSYARCCCCCVHDTRSNTPSTCSDRWGRYTPKGRRLSDVHFRDLSVRQVRCYTILSGCRLPWPPSCCPYREMPFRDLVCRCNQPLVTFASRVEIFPGRAYGSVRLASSAYQNEPT